MSRYSLPLLIALVGTVIFLGYMGSRNQLGSQAKDTSSSLTGLRQSAAEYNISESKELVYYAAAAYCHERCIVAWNCKIIKDAPVLTDITHLSNPLSLLTGFVGYSAARNYIVVSFRGSDNAQNWVEDFNFEFIDYGACKGCKIHAGFFEDYKSVQRKMIESIDEIFGKYPMVKTIVTTGHSLGAAVGLISAFELHSHYTKQGKMIKSHNYGCPRLGNKQLADYIDSQIPDSWRVVHHKDIVPHVPPEAFEYRHPNYEVFFNKENTNYQICKAEDSKCSNQYFPDYSFADHGQYFIDLASVQC